MGGKKHEELEDSPSVRKRNKNQSMCIIRHLAEELSNNNTATREKEGESPLETGILEEGTNHLFFSTIILIFNDGIF